MNYQDEIQLGTRQQIVLHSHKVHNNSFVVQAEYLMISKINHAQVLVKLFFTSKDNSSIRVAIGIMVMLDSEWISKMLSHSCTNDTQHVVFNRLDRS